MSYPTRSIPSHIRQPSMAPHSASTSQSPALVARVNEKKAELESLKELRDLSAAVASQMEALEQKLATLSDGTEGMAQASEFRNDGIWQRELTRPTAIALVMANWHNVLRAISMASCGFFPLPNPPFIRRKSTDKVVSQQNYRSRNPTPRTARRPCPRLLSVSRPSTHLLCKPKPTPPRTSESG